MRRETGHRSLENLSQSLVDSLAESFDFIAAGDLARAVEKSGTMVKLAKESSVTGSVALQTRIMHASLLLSVGNLKQGMAACESILKEDKPDNPHPIRLRMGNALLEGGDFGGAVKQYRMCLDSVPPSSAEYGGISANLGLALLKTGNYAEALASYKEARPSLNAVICGYMAKDSESVKLEFLRLLQCGERGAILKAAALVVQCLGSHDWLLKVVANGEVKSAVELDRAKVGYLTGRVSIESFVSLPLSDSNRAFLSICRKDLKAAEEAAALAVSNNRFDESALNNLAVCRKDVSLLDEASSLVTVEDPVGSIVRLNRALLTGSVPDSVPYSVIASLARVHCLNKVGKFSQAVNEATTLATKTLRNDPSLLLALGNLYEKNLNNDLKAFRAFKDALDLTPCCREALEWCENFAQ